MSHTFFSYRLAQRDEILTLRHEVLRPGMPREAAEFPEDVQPTTLHFGAFDERVNIACATLIAQPFNGVEAWRLRGMATHPQYRNHGIGGNLLQFIEKHMQQIKPDPPMWCDARIKAHRFYLKHGWKIASKQFMIPTVGLHYKMTRNMDIETVRVMLDDLQQVVREEPNDEVQTQDAGQADNSRDNQGKVK